ncbi:MAG: electron transfer flavoprotein subunit alpha/FixB family protein [Dehalococcoidia bacterium]|nr:electron transfer flavoprotein subunit alpha/FixB family protein [Dehalococcoidia bacterium]
MTGAIPPCQVAVVLASPADPVASAQLLATARRLATVAGTGVFALVTGGEGAPHPDATGADAIVRFATACDVTDPESLLHAAHEVVLRARPRVLLFAHDAAGREVAPRLAARLGAPVITDCVDAHIDAAGTLTAIRPCFSAKALSDWSVPAPHLAIVTLRRDASPGEAASAASPPPDGGLVLPSAPAPRLRVIERHAPPPGELQLEAAEIVVAAGRGVGSRQDFQTAIANGLAKDLGAAFGGSRGAVDLGIVPQELQIGLTGRVVSPRVYIAVGLSGAPQHMAGCSGARTIIAVNTDPRAPIFGYAHLGVVGDYRAVLPSLASELRRLAPAR